MESIYERTSRGYTQQGDYLSTNLQLNGEPEYNINVNLKMYSFDHLRMYNIDHINTFCSRR